MLMIVPRVPAAHHLARARLRDAEHAREVDVEHAVPVASSLSSRLGAARDRAGVVDDDRRRAELGADRAIASATLAASVTSIA